MQPTPSLTPTTRHRLPSPATTGRRKGFHRIVTQVTEGNTNANAFQGPYIPDNEETDLTPASVVVRKTPGGSARNPLNAWHYAHVPPKGQPWHWNGPYRDEDFLTFRDAVKQALITQPTLTQFQPPHFIQTLLATPPRPADTPTLQDFRSSMETLLNLPGILHVTYDPASNILLPVTADNQEHHQSRPLLQLANRTFQNLTLNLPDFVRDQLSWTDLAGAITLPDEVVFQAYFGLPMSLMTLENTQPSPPPDTLVADSLSLTLAAALTRIPPYRAQLWQALQHYLSTSGFRLTAPSEGYTAAIALHPPE